MWIPEGTTPKDSDVRLAVITSAEALIATKGINSILRDVYLSLVEYHKNKIPVSSEVCTHHFEGIRVKINPVQAHALNKLGLLGEQQSTNKHGYGMTGYSRFFAWRMLDTVKMYQLIGDSSLPEPDPTVIVNEVS